MSHGRKANNRGCERLRNGHAREPPAPSRDQARGVRRAQLVQQLLLSTLLEPHDRHLVSGGPPRGAGEGLLEPLLHLSKRLACRETSHVKLSDADFLQEGAALDQARQRVQVRPSHAHATRMHAPAPASAARAAPAGSAAILLRSPGLAPHHQSAHRSVLSSLVRHESDFPRAP